MMSVEREERLVEFTASSAVVTTVGSRDKRAEQVVTAWNKGARDWPLWLSKPATYGARSKHENNKERRKQDVTLSE